MNTITTQLPFKGVMTSFIGGRKENQDTCGYSDTSRGLLLVVCDGMGGGPGGKTASSIAATTLIAYVQQAGSLPEAEKMSNEALLHDAIIAANKALRDKILEVPELDGMGTTVTAVLLSETGAALAHVGDSRIYQIRRNKIVFRTADHSRVGEMVRAGALTDEQARLSAISNLITRALGIGDEVQVDTATVTYEKGDRFALCTDGVWGSMPQPELVKAFCDNKSLQNTADLLNLKVENAGKDKGGHHDNYTMIIVETLAASVLPAKTEAKAANAASGPDVPPTPGADTECPPVPTVRAPRKIDSRIIAAIITAAIITPAIILALMYMPMGSTDAPLPDDDPQEQPADSIGTEDHAPDTAPQPDKESSETTLALEDKPTPVTTSTPTTPAADSNTASVENPTPAETSATTTETPATDIEALNARKAALIQIINRLTELRKLILTLKKTAGISGTSATNTFKNAKRNALLELDNLSKVSGYQYTNDEHYMLFAVRGQSGKYNGIAGALGGENVTAMPDTSGCNIIINHRIDILLPSMREKLQETENQLSNLQQEQGEKQS